MSNARCRGLNRACTSIKLLRAWQCYAPLSLRVQQVELLAELGAGGLQG
jgi:hypothetical protein